MVLAFLLRVLWLDNFPPGFTPDEASFGYDAYSILKTGRDQWGNPMPLVLKSFGDFKAPLYSYLAVPTVAVFGLTKFAVRLPNALLGTFAVLATYLLVKEMFKKARVGLLAGFLLVVSPWHTMLSRGAFEANLTSFFMPLGLYFFLKGLKKNSYFVLSAVVFGLNLFTYHSAKLLTPFVVFACLWFFRTEVKKVSKGHLVIFSSVLAIFLLLGFVTMFQGGGSRVSEVNIFNTALGPATQARAALLSNGAPAWVARFVHNKYFVGVRMAAGNYFSYFSPQFLFSSGAAETTYGMFPGRGALFWLELPLLLAFLVHFRKLFSVKAVKVLLVWLLVSPMPAALTSGSGYAANRAAGMLPVIHIFSALGILFFANRERVSKLVYKVVFVASFVFLYFFLEGYFLVAPRVIAQGMLYGNLEVAEWLSENIGKNEKVIVSRGLSEPQIYIAFAKKIDPELFQNASKRWDYKANGVNWVDQIPIYQLANFTFKNIELDLDINEAHYLVGKPSEFGDKLAKLISFSYPSGEEAVVIVRGKAEYYAAN